MFFESVPDAFVDVSLDKWHFDEGTQTIPIIIPRNYLNLYNFGFAQSRNLPKLSEGVMGLIQMDINMRGNGRVEQYKGNIVGFSNRLNTILVPQSFMEWANQNFAPEREAQPSRLIVEVKNPTDTAITDYFQQKNYETEGDNLDAGKTTYFLRLITGIVSGVGLFISILSFYILMLSVFLLLQKNTAKLENLLLIGYSPSKVALPYHVLTVGLNLLVLLLAVIGVVWFKILLHRSPANSYSTTGNRLSSALYPHRKYLIYSGIRFKHPPDTKESSLHLERKQMITVFRLQE